jgi:sulfatase maturation enzyme AslB (radical SAM superfamily)
MPRLYSSLKYLHFPDRIEALRERRLVAPVHIRIKPTNRCNHDCWYCAYRNSNLHLGEDMQEAAAIPPGKMMEIADDIVAMGVEAVTFSGGGEPLIYKPLADVIERLAAGKVKVAALTNGLNLKGRMADAFASHGTWVRISIDAWDNDSYRAIRSARPGDFDQVLANMRNFADRGSGCVLGVSFIIEERNHHRVAEVCRRFKDMGVNHVKLSGVVTGNTAAECNTYHRRFAEAAHVEVEKAKELADEDFAIIDHFHDVVERFDKPYSVCPNLMFLTVIGADQVVYSCQDKAYTRGGTLGSIEKRSFREFWFSEENHQRLHGLDPSRDCGHHCMAHATNLHILDFLSLDPNHVPFV